MIDLPPRPVPEYEHNDGFGLPVLAAYTPAQMQAYGRECARAALEAAAERVKDLDAYCGGHGMPSVPGSDAYVKAIRAMKVAP
jgi:hypothetical protein